MFLNCKRAGLSLSVIWAVTISCQRESLFQTDSAHVVPAEVTFSVYAGAVEGTKSTIADDCMDRITDLDVFLYRGGILCKECSVYASGCDFNIQIPDTSADYDVFVVANAGDVRNVVEQNCLRQEDLESWVYDLGDYSGFRDKGVPMAGSLRSWHLGDTDEIVLRRLVSRIDVRFVNSSDYNVSVRSMRLCQSARKVSPFSNGYRATSGEDVFAEDDLNDSLTADDIDAAMKEGATVSMYCCENMQGDLMPWNTKPELKNINNIPSDRSGVVTYFEVDAFVSSDDVRWESVKYRFCLGRDVTGNFDVPRNCILGYTLDFASTPSDTGWTVEPDEPLYPGDIKIHEHLSPYYPGWDVFTFPDAASASPVTIVSPWGEFTVDGEHASVSGNVTEELGLPCIVVGNQFFVRCPTEYELECMCADMHKSNVRVPGDKEKVSYVLAARNAGGQTVRVDYLKADDDYGLYLCPWSESEHEVVDWDETFFPEPIIELFGRQRISDFSRSRTSVEIYENEGRLDEDSGYRFYPSESSFGLLSNCGQPYFEISAPGEECYLAYKINVFGYNGQYGFMDINVFDDESIGESHTLPEVSIDNTYGNLYVEDNGGIYTVHIEDTSTPYWSAVRNLRIHTYKYINKGEMSFSIDEESKDIVIRLNEYSCGEACLRMLFWDYDTAPGGYYTLPLKIYLDITYVPKFGILRRGGSYGMSSFSAASLLHEGAHTTLSSRVWGYQYLPARRDSYYRTGFNAASSYRDALMEVIGNSSPSIVAAAYDPGFPDGSGRVALYNAGSILENEGTPYTYCDMPNEGSVFFCDPVAPTSSLWSLEYDAKVLDPMYRYMFTPVTSKEKLDNIASYQLDNCSRGNPVFRGDNGDSADVMHVELYDGIMVNYHLRYDTCLEMLAGEWDRY